MAERVATGGTKSFEYREGDISELDAERKADIAKGYEEYYYRRKIEKRKRIVIAAIIILVILLAVFFYLVK